MTNKKSTTKSKTSKSTTTNTTKKATTKMTTDNTKLQQNTPVDLDSLEPDMYKSYRIWATSHDSEEPLFLMFIPHDPENVPIIWETFNEEKITEELVASYLEKEDGIEVLSSYLAMMGGVLRVDELVPKETK